MSNMSYCRFENTYNDLLECFEALQEDGVETLMEEANDYEREYIPRLIELCREIVNDFDEYP